MKDLIILGSGPAGIAAAIYAARAELDFCVIEKEYVSGGQITTTAEIDNYPGFYHLGGFDLGMKFKEHADALGVPFVNAEVIKLELKGEGKDSYVAFSLSDGQCLEAKTCIFATGAKHRKLGVAGEEKLIGSGVSYCATCDGAFFKGKTVAVVGGGDVALEDALFLSRMCKDVYLIHRRNEFRAAKTSVTALRKTENVHFVLDSVIKEISGQFKVESITVSNLKTGADEVIDVSGVFIAVGMEPMSSLLADIVEMDKSGYIVAGEDCRTSSDRIFVAGDVRTKILRQVVTAASDGAVAVTGVEKYLNEIND